MCGGSVSDMNAPSPTSANCSPQFGFVNLVGVEMTVGNGLGSARMISVLVLLSRNYIHRFSGEYCFQKMHYFSPPQHTVGLSTMSWRWSSDMPRTLQIAFLFRGQLACPGQGKTHPLADGQARRATRPLLRSPTASLLGE